MKYICICVIAQRPKTNNNKEKKYTSIPETKITFNVTTHSVERKNLLKNKIEKEITNK